MRPQPRWPLHPPPAEQEALSSWVARLAHLYGLSPADLLRHNLGPASALAEGITSDDLDWDPPPALLFALSERTGAPADQLRALTIAGWVPWLIDSLDELGQDGFDTYVRQHSVLSASGTHKRYLVGPHWRPWITDPPIRRVCPACTANPDHPTPLTAGLPLMLSCAEHGCRLKPTIDVNLALVITGEHMPPEAVSAAVAAMDRRTDEGLRTGTVTLPGRAVHVGLWFRLLRTLVHELSGPLPDRRSRLAAAHERIWSAIGQPVRASSRKWRPYEQLNPERQQQLLEAGATAMQLAEDGAITARGTLGPLLAREPGLPVYDGDPPSQRDRDLRQARQEIDAAVDAARTDPGGAREVLELFTRWCPTLQAFDRQRQFLIDQGIPERLLPNARELGRTDLAHDPPQRGRRPGGRRAPRASRRPVTHRRAAD